MVGKRRPDFGDELDEVLRVPVGHVQTDEGDIRKLTKNGAQVVKVTIGSASTASHVRKSLRVL